MEPHVQVQSALSLNKRDLTGVDTKWAARVCIVICLHEYHVSVPFHSSLQAYHADVPSDKIACVNEVMQRLGELPERTLTVKHLSVATQRKLFELAWEKRYGDQRVAHWVGAAKKAFFQICG